ncbi:MAG TPA: DUF6457 domain-containing protein [Micromonosporaceae bacterium]|nr:DUF6457 domain-containing protein [Micromonosporaceae bacterium]
MNVLDEWSAAAAAALGVQGFDAADRQLVLELAKVVAHGVVRPGAPVSAYLLGVAVGRGADPRTAAATLTALARAWPPPEPAAPPDPAAPESTAPPEPTAPPGTA